MSSPPSEEDSVSSQFTSGTADVHTSSIEMQSVLEKQLLMEKTRATKLFNDNQRLLSQNIGLCRAVKQQKRKIDQLCVRNHQLQQQVSKLFLTVTTLGKTQKQICVKDSEFVVLKECIMNLQNMNAKLSKEIETKTTQLHAINDKSEIDHKTIHSLQDTLNAKNDEIDTLSNQIKQWENTYQESVEKKDWWKSEAETLEKECELHMTEMRELKSQLNKQDVVNNNLWRKKYYLSLWTRFEGYLKYQLRLEQVHDVWHYLKDKYKPSNKSREPFKESFKLSLFKTLKDVKDVDIDRLLLCEDTQQLKDFFLSSNMSPELQLKVAAQLLPVVENYRINLQKDINRQIDEVIKKASKTRNDNYLMHI